MLRFERWRCWELATEVANPLASAFGEVDFGIGRSVHHECAVRAIELKSGDRDHGAREFGRLSEGTTIPL